MRHYHARRSWYLLVASFDASNARSGFCKHRVGHRIERDAIEERSVEFPHAIVPAGAALIAARHDPVDGVVAHFDGRIEGPAFYGGAL